MFALKSTGYKEITLIFNNNNNNNNKPGHD